jgi:hypothetical protein
MKKIINEAYSKPYDPNRVFAFIVIAAFCAVCLVAGLTSVYGFCIWAVGSIDVATIIYGAELLVFFVSVMGIGFCVKRFFRL